MDLDAASRDLLKVLDATFTWMRENEPERLDRPGWVLVGERMDDLRGALAVDLDAALDDSTTQGRTTDPETSTKAQTIASLRAGKSKHLLGEVFFDHPAGLTAEEAIEKAELTHQKSPWHRVSDLKIMKVIAPTGKTRLVSSGAEADILAMTEEGRQAWAERFR